MLCVIVATPSAVRTQLFEVVMSQRVLVTGAASGVGLEIAHAFSTAGARVFITDINEQALATAQREVPALLTGVCDNSKRSDIERMVPAAVGALGGLDVLVNNAGIGGPTAPVEGVDPEAWDTVIAVNVTGTFHVTRLAIPHLKKSAAGSIIIMSSLGGRFGYPNRSPYCVSKWGLIGFAKTLAIELGADNIRANAIAPGAVGGQRMERVLTGRAEAAGTSIEEARAAMLSIQSLRRFVDPKDIAALCVYLASDAGTSISGQVIPIDNDAHQAS
jgi:NAD(P)-dependent dehydrogenase (short-subunit alcohol dehydrogenase family)